MPAPPIVRAVLETALYVDDLDAAALFYRDVLGLREIVRERGRHVFFRCGDGVLLLFDPDGAAKPPAAGAPPIPTHGARGQCHVCFAASAGEIAAWAGRLEAAGVAIESVVDWPQGGRSIYFRDPSGNSLEFAEPRIWGV